LDVSAKPSPTDSREVSDGFIVGPVEYVVQTYSLIAWLQ